MDQLIVIKRPKLHLTLPFFTAVIFFFLVGCDNQLLSQSVENQSDNRTQDSQPQNADLPEMSGQVISTASGDQLEFRVILPSTSSFQTQAVDLTQIKYLRIWVRGEGISDRIWNQGGYAEMVNGMTLQVRAVPKGSNRVVSAQGYDSNKQPIPGALLKAVYSSPPDNNTVTVILKWRFVPEGEVIETLLDMDSTLIKSLDAGALQAVIDKVIYGNNAVGGNTYAVHPSRMDAKAIATAIQAGGGQIPDLPKQPMLKAVGTATLVVRNPQGNVFTQGVLLAIDDPGSIPITLNGGTDTGQVENLSEGSWNATAKIEGLNGGVKRQIPLSVDNKGNITQTEGTAGNPLILPAVIKNITGPVPTPFPLGLIRWWPGEDDANDKIGSRSGTLQNGANFLAGMTGKAFNLNGVNQFISIPSVPNLPTQVAVNNGFSLSAWVKTTVPGNLIVKQYECGKLCISGVSNSWLQLSLNGAGFPAFSLRDTTGISDSVTGSTSLADGYYHYVVAVRDVGTGKLSLYADGKLAIDKPLTATGALKDDDGDDDPLVIGAGYIAGSPALSNFWNGQIDEVMFFDRALSASEIQAQYASRSTVLTGDGFHTLPGSNSVPVNAVPTFVSGASPASLTLTVPPETFGPAPLNVTINGKTSNTANMTIPVMVAGISRAMGIVGDSIMIAGSGFYPTPANNTVKFNGTSAPVTASTTTTLTVTVPPGVTEGPVSVSNPAGIAIGPTFVPPPANLVSWWQAEGDANDKMGSNNGTLQLGASGNTNPATAFAPGKIGYTLNLDGVDDRVAIPHTPSLFFNSSFTILAWVNPSSLTNSPLILSKETTIANRFGFQIASNGSLCGYFDSGSCSVTSAAGTVATGTFSHVAFVFDDGSNQNRLYKNGVQAGIAAEARNLTGTTATLELGRSILVSPTQFSGLLDEVQIYNRALSTAEIQAIYNATK